jgi:hypothetical protein
VLVICGDTPRQVKLWISKASPTGLKRARLKLDAK